MPRSTWERVGPLDEAFGIGFFEDDDYCRRVEAAGLRVACADDVFVHHHLSASFDALKAERKRELFERNKAIYEAKWGPWVPHAYRRH
jgi:GT2 family glycosyltransferase